MKLIAIQSKSDPEIPGYNDYGFIIDNYEPGLFQNGIVSVAATILWRGDLSAQPNPNMFCILKDHWIDKDKDRAIWIPMSTMSYSHRSWCTKCTRPYCQNNDHIAHVMDQRIDCKLYGRLACNKLGDHYAGQFTNNHPKFGRCILINNGETMPSVQPDSEHNGEHWCRSIFIHKGYASNWRGSAACITIPPDGADIFFDYFSEEELIRIELFDYRALEATRVASYQ